MCLLLLFIKPLFSISFIYLFIYLFSFSLVLFVKDNWNLLIIINISFIYCCDSLKIYILTKIGERSAVFVYQLFVNIWLVVNSAIRRIDVRPSSFLLLSFISLVRCNGWRKPTPFSFFRLVKKEEQYSCLFSKECTCVVTSLLCVMRTRSIIKYTWIRRNKREKWTHTYTHVRRRPLLLSLLSVSSLC